MLRPPPPRAPQVDAAADLTEAALCGGGAVAFTLKGLPERGGYAVGLRLVTERPPAAVARCVEWAPLEGALLRVRAQLQGGGGGGGGSGGGGGGGSGGGGGGIDCEVELSGAVLSLRCPLSGARVCRPARFSSVCGGGGAARLEVFDLDSFLAMAQHTRKIQARARTHTPRAGICGV